MDGPLRLARGSHRAGTGRGCGGNVLSWECGEDPITDFPACTAVPLAKLLHTFNDRICRHTPDRVDDQSVPVGLDLLCPACSMLVLDVAHSTVGTGGARPTPSWRWAADVVALAARSVTAPVLSWRRAELGRLAQECAARLAMGSVWGGAFDAMDVMQAGHVASQALVVILGGNPGDAVGFTRSAVGLWHTRHASAPVPVEASVTAAAVERMARVEPSAADTGPLVSTGQVWDAALASSI